MALQKTYRLVFAAGGQTHIADSSLSRERADTLCAQLKRLGVDAWVEPEGEGIGCGRVIVPEDTLALLRTWKTSLGASRDACYEAGQKLWDRIEAVLGAARPEVEPGFTYEAEAQRIGNGEVAVWTDGVSLHADNDRCCAFPLKAGRHYRVSVLEIPGNAQATSANVAQSD
jgi:hypothetical protein